MYFDAPVLTADAVLVVVQDPVDVVRAFAEQVAAAETELRIRLGYVWQAHEAAQVDGTCTAGARSDAREHGPAVAIALELIGGDVGAKSGLKAEAIVEHRTVGLNVATQRGFARLGVEPRSGAAQT